MNIQQIQFNRQKVAALLLASSILAATASLTWVEISLSQANQGTGAVKTEAVGYDSGLSPQFHLSSVKGGKGGICGDVGK